MISRQDAERIAAVWARRETLRLGYECVPRLSEFDMGYLVWSQKPTHVLQAPGSGVTTIIDKETGELSHWPGLPPPVVEDLYRQRRAGRSRPPRTVDPAAELLRNTNRLPTPGSAAHLSVRHEQFIARGAKGDLKPRHHPLIQSYLDTLPTGHLVRGGERHAELVVVSDALHAYDHQLAQRGEPPMGLAAARELLATSYLEVFRVREPGDPAGGPVETPCESCIQALVHFGVIPWSDLAFTEEWRPAPQSVPDPDRFPVEVGHSLVEAGWQPTVADGLLARRAIAEVVEVPGVAHRHEAFPAVERTLTAFPGLVCGRRGAGEQVWIRRFEINPTAAAHSADSLADLGAVIGVRLFPIGTERGDSILAVDERGRIFALDQAGEWFIGDDIDAALTNLLLGRAPSRIRDDGTW